MGFFSKRKDEDEVEVVITNRYNATKRDTYYLAGPMTGYKDFNLPFFDTITEALSLNGFKVLNPADNGRNEVPGARPYKWYIDAGLTQLSECDAIILLPGWQKSAGACLELAYARTCKMRVWYLVNDMTATGQQGVPFYDLVRGE